jgi:S1-C subfamily serine protease
MAAALVGSFVFATTLVKRGSLQSLLGRGGDGPLWSGPSVTQGAGLSADEQNNISIYERSQQATVHITSIVYRRGWFTEIYPTEGSGSGFFVNDKGDILTNNHVVSGSAELRVTTWDQKNYRAEIVDRDQANDLALIKINVPKGVKSLPLGNSDGLKVGQKVLAIGNPFGLDNTLTTGIVSARNRDISDEGGRTLEGMIQTDAAINPGNSGGPLLDSSGNVIGINTAILGRAGSIGIGFAMPINRAKAMLDSRQAGRKFERPKLGVSVVQVKGDLAEELGYPREGGLLIQGVVEGSPAQAAGLRGARREAIVGGAYTLGIGGDLIVAIDGRRVERVDALTVALGGKRQGDRLVLRVLRGGKESDVTVNLGRTL